MMNWRLGLGLIAATFLNSACSHLSAPKIETPPTAQIMGDQMPDLPNVLPTEDINEVEILQEHVKLLEQNVFLLQEQVRALNRQQAALNQNLNTLARNQQTHIKTVALEDDTLPHDAIYSKAYAQYQKKQYQMAIQTLRPYSSGGNGSAEASNGMYLLMLSHKQLKQCESTITVGRHFQQRFPTHIRAAEALYSVGQCQYDMQQKDIARETWKRVRVLYPHSAAARMAAQQLR